MKLAARLAFESLRGEGLTVERIAGIANASTTAVRMWAKGLEIPAGSAMRMIIAVRVLAGLKLAPHRDGEYARDEIAAFARGWLAAHGLQRELSHERAGEKNRLPGRTFRSGPFKST